MLVLSRKREEKLQIGSDITITILKVKGNSVQIGIEAPKCVRVLRNELVVPSGAGRGAADEASHEEDAFEASANADDVPRPAVASSMKSMVERVLTQSV